MSLSFYGINLHGDEGRSPVEAPSKQGRRSKFLGSLEVWGRRGSFGGPVSPPPVPHPLISLSSELLARDLVSI